MLEYIVKLQMRRRTSWWTIYIWMKMFSEPWWSWPFRFNYHQPSAHHRLWNELRCPGETNKTRGCNLKSCCSHEQYHWKTELAISSYFYPANAFSHIIISCNVICYLYWHILLFCLFLIHDGLWHEERESYSYTQYSHAIFFSISVAIFFNNRI